MASRTESTVWRVSRVENDGNAIALGNGLHLTDGEGSQVFVKENAPKAGKFRHLRLDPGQNCVIADKRTTTAWEVKRDNRMEYLHPTQKPTELAEIALRNSSKEGDIVVDCFGGSFSTLMAAHAMKRRGFVMDLEPKWCAVGIERWHRATNEQPVLLT
jgi:DNA modification methylase